VHELVQPVRVRILLVPEAGAGRSFGRGPNAIAPVVAVGKATARPAEDRRLDRAHRIDKGLANATFVGNLGAFANPDAVVDHAAELLDKVAVDFRRDGANWFSRKNVDAGISLRGLGQNI
jgi:hypothetical protein